MQQIADWLQKVGLGQYAQRFAENDITFFVRLDALCVRRRVQLFERKMLIRVSFTKLFSSWFARRNRFRCTMIERPEMVLLQLSRRKTPPTGCSPACGCACVQIQPSAP